MSPRVSLCMIVKNEQENLSACVTPVRDLVDEIIIVDTGSSDRTKQIAAELGGRLFEFPWIDDFAAARNESLRHATGRWIFWLDADDRVDPANRRRLQKLFSGLGDEMAVYVMQCISTYASGTAMVEHVRLFRNLPEMRWKYRIHEQILPAARRLGHQIRATDIVIQHGGYQHAGAHEQKSLRNLQQLQRALQDYPNDPYLLCHLGWAYMALGRAAEGIPALRQSLQHSTPDEPMVRIAGQQLARGYHQLGQFQQALDACRDALVRFPDDGMMLFLQSTIQERLGHLAAAEAGLLKLLQPGAGLVVVDPGLLGYKTRHTLGGIYYKQKRHGEAEAQWRAALAEQPGFIPTLVSLGELYLGQRRWDDAEKALRDILALDPTNTYARQKLSDLLRRPGRAGKG